MITQSTIQSENFDLFTVKRTKIALDAHDDKRVEVDNFCTVPYGYKKM